MMLAYTIEAVTRPFGINHPFSPIRIKKLGRSNNILPGYLIEQGYNFEYSLEDAFIDWMAVCPEEWD